MRLFYVALLVLFFSGCDSKGSEQAEPKKANVLKEYVEVPKEKATAAKDKVEAMQGAVHQQAQGLEDE